jgi:hypothetical protein
MKFAIIENGIVINIALADPEYAESQGWIEVNGNAGIGWLYVDGKFVEPPPAPIPVPQQITMRQARLELLNVGKLDDVDAALASIPDEHERKAAQIEWEYATIIERTAPLVKSLTPALGFTEDEMDDLFRRAALL